MRAGRVCRRRGTVGAKGGSAEGFAVVERLSDGLAEDDIGVVEGVEGNRADLRNVGEPCGIKRALIDADIDDLADEPPGLRIIALDAALDGNRQLRE